MVTESKQSARPPSDLTSDARLLLARAWRLEPRQLVVQVVLLVLAGLAGGASLLLLVPIVNTVADANESIDVPGFGSLPIGQVPLWALLAVFVGLIGVQAWLTRWSTVATARFQQRLVDQLRHEALSAVLGARWEFILGFRNSDIVQAVTTGATRCGLAYQQMMGAAVALVTSVVTAIVALAISPPIAAIAIGAVIAVAVAQGTVVRPAYRLGVLFGDRSRNLQSVLTDSMDALRLVRAHDASEPWSDRLDEAFVAARDVQLESTERMSSVSALSTVGVAAAASLLVLASVALGVPPTTIVVIVVIIARLNVQVQGVVTKLGIAANALPAVRDLVTLSEEATAAAETASVDPSDRGPVSNAPSTPLVELRSASFRYESSAGGIQDLSFVIPRGQVTVLAGPSGAGKSTTADLILGLLVPQSGAVVVDGVVLTSRDLSWWRQHVAYVPQEPLLMPGTLRDNLLWSAGRPVTDAACWSALEKSAADFVRTWPDGLDTTLGERGVRLSGGERQRISLARALVRDPTLLILDEPTSALDDETEASVLRTVRSLTPAVTVLLIAHRASTIAVGQHVVMLGG